VGAFKAAALWSTTVLLALSDNGGALGSGASNHPYRGGKFSPLEGGTRSASFVHSELIPAARRGGAAAVLAHAVDLYPTVLGLAGLAPAEGSPEQPLALDGHDLWADIVGGTAELAGPRTELLYNLDPTGYMGDIGASCLTDDFGGSATGALGSAALRVGRWKLLWCRDGAGEHSWLYDLHADPGEVADRAAARPDKLRELRERLAEWAALAAAALVGPT
jgi:arylsulfatase A-like enzyme